VIFEIFASSEKLKSHGIDLDVFIDDYKINTLKIQSYKPNRFVKKVNLGIHTWKLVLNESDSGKQETEGSLSIDMIRIKALKDILIISGADDIERGMGVKF
jgi:sporulation protein YlmC with PRC-barrel domain